MTIQAGEVNARTKEMSIDELDRRIQIAKGNPKIQKLMMGSAYGRPATGTLKGLHVLSDTSLFAIDECTDLPKWVWWIAKYPMLYRARYAILWTVIVAGFIIWEWSRYNG